MDFNVASYAPENSKQLLPEELAAMEFFTLDQLNQLAKAYPNKSNQRPYLVLKDKSKKDQIWPVMTWENYRNLHVMGLKHFVAVSFKDIFFKTRGGQPVKEAPLQDLTKEEVLSGLNVKEVTVETAPEQNVERTEFDEHEDSEFEELSKEAEAKATGKKAETKTKTNKGSAKGKK